MKIIITGGHLSPALSVVEALPKKDIVLIVGRKHTFEGDSHFSFEHQVANSLKIPFITITTGRLQQTFTRYTIGSVAKIPIGFFQALKIVKKFKPDVVLSFGGYVSLPIVIAAAFLQIPIVVHEQTLEAGLANKIASFFASKICISWKSSSKFFPKSKTIVTGIPIRKFQISNFKFQISNERLPLLYITAGSGGSHSINLLIEGCIKKLLEKFYVFHQTGSSDFKDYGRLETLKRSLNKTLQKRYTLTKFIEPSEVGSIISASDLVVSRSGINTVSELIYFGKPALLIPLNKEQEKNALYLCTLGFAEIASQDAIDSNTLYEKIIAMLENKSLYEKHAMEAKKILTLDAAQKIIDVVHYV